MSICSKRKSTIFLLQMWRASGKSQGFAYGFWSNSLSLPNTQRRDACAFSLEGRKTPFKGVECTFDAAECTFKVAECTFGGFE